IFSLLAIFVTGLGIFGLSSFMTLQRTREIGIRKVLGAEVPRIVFLLSKDFMVLLSISFVLSLPLVLMGIDRWLSGFALRMDLSVLLFALPLVMVSVITFLTMSAHVIKAALANPIDSIRYE
ncbi:MAG: ABC transporter permease, partial [bacterium]|nr:ABC transporter permease [bacterium]